MRTISKKTSSWWTIQVLIRNELGLSQKEVAHRLHIAYQSYQAWENPKVANPTLKQLSKLAGAVGKKLIIDMV
jgi:transcriptional regulator with XRE-family HTH domain